MFFLLTLKHLQNLFSRSRIRNIFIFSISHKSRESNCKRFFIINFPHPTCILITELNVSSFDFPNQTRFKPYVGFKIADVVFLWRNFKLFILKKIMVMFVIFISKTYTNFANRFKNIQVRVKNS